jgi:transitional endoplasmic reticulum ATPase
MYRQKNPLDIDGINVTSKAKYILQKGLALKAADRFANINDILSVLDSQNVEIDGEPSTQSTAPHKQQDSTNAMQDLNTISIDIQRGGGNGFADIAGMQELKDYLTKTVIFFMKNKDIAQQYGITPPNGMLLYGPPGCGKTFFAEKFAEETGFNFMLVKSSDVGSSLVHGTQEKVKKLFKQAEKNSPIVLCFDEFDAIVPDRGARGNEYVASEVNEFLSQMNNCSKRGIFIVATSNRPDKIDPAILRTGRIDKQVYVPLPDLEARKEMFKMYLNNRPVEGEFDIDSFAKRTEGYIASDIAFIVNDAAMTAAFTRKPITTDLLNTAITNTRPSLQKEVIEEYSYIRNRMDGIARRNVVTGL